MWPETGRGMRVPVFPENGFGLVSASLAWFASGVEARPQPHERLW